MAVVPQHRDLQLFRKNHLKWNNANHLYSCRIYLWLYVVRLDLVFSLLLFFNEGERHFRPEGEVQKGVHVSALFFRVPSPVGN